MKIKVAPPATPNPHPWSKDALLAKAQRYVEEMLSQPRADWKFTFWSSLGLELLGRAALANINPALLSDSNSWDNLYFGLGYSPTTTKFVAKSLDFTSVVTRLRTIVPEFHATLADFTLSHLAKRNEELHSGNTPFDSIANSSWLPTYYQTCDALLGSMGETLDSFLGPDEAEVARKMITASQDESAKSVGKSLQAHKTVWENLSQDEKDKLNAKASSWATRTNGHRSTCPSCGCDALVYGDPVAAPKRTLDEDQIIETQDYLPSKFECVACKLKILGLSQLNAAGLGDTYMATFIYDASELYAPQDEYAEFEPDFNEQF